MKKLSAFQISWTIAIFNTRLCNPKKWRQFRLKYERNFITNHFINNHNKIAIWHLDKERINWIKNNLPKDCFVRFIPITDYQFGKSEIFYGNKE